MYYAGMKLIHLLFGVHNKEAQSLHQIHILSFTRFKNDVYQCNFILKEALMKNSGDIIQQNISSAAGVLNAAISSADNLATNC